MSLELVTCGGKTKVRVHLLAEMNIVGLAFLKFSA